MNVLQQVLPMEEFAHPASIVSISFLAVLFLYWYGTRGFANLKKLNVPGPKPLPFIGNFLEARKYEGIQLMHLDGTESTAKCSRSVWAKNRHWSLQIRSYSNRL